VSELEPPSAGPASVAQLVCAAAVLAAVVMHLPVQRIVFLGDPLGIGVLGTPAGRPLGWTAILGILLAAAQLIALRRPAPSTALRRAAVAVAVVGVWLGFGIAALGVYAGLVHDLDPRMQPTVGPGALLLVASGLTYAGLAGWTAFRLLGRPQPGKAGDSSLGQSRGRRAVVLVLPGAVVILVLTVVALGRRSGGDDEDDWQPPPVPAGAREEMERLRGVWLVVRTEPPGVTPVGARLTFDGDRVTAMRPTARPQLYRIDPTRRPKEIDFPIWVNGEQYWSLAIYELDGDRLTLCLVEVAAETGPDAGLYRRPRSFTDRGTGYVWHFERARPAP